tara:strand:+ start:1897 stop:2181 length:285 start_codon:yes stop_codon:yes gene_type:complete
MKKEKSFGSSKAFGGGKDISFPKHLTPEIIHSALFVFNAPKEEIAQRVQYCAKQIGDEAMSYAMALLVLPELQKMTMQSDEYKEWQSQRFKKLN